MCTVFRNLGAFETRFSQGLVEVAVKSPPSTGNRGHALISMLPVLGWSLTVRLTAWRFGELRKMLARAWKCGNEKLKDTGNMCVAVRT